MLHLQEEQLHCIQLHPNQSLSVLGALLCVWNTSNDGRFAFTLCRSALSSPQSTSQQNPSDQIRCSSISGLFKEKENALKALFPHQAAHRCFQHHPTLLAPRLQRLHGPERSPSGAEPRETPSPPPARPQTQAQQ